MPSPPVHVMSDPAALFEELANFLEFCGIQPAADAMRQQEYRRGLDCVTRPGFVEQLRRLSEVCALFAQEAEALDPQAAAQKASAGLNGDPEANDALFTHHIA